MTTKTKQLHEVLAIEKGVKQRTYTRIDEIQKVLPKTDFFNGHYRKWLPLTDDSEVFPPENKKVQCFATEMLQEYIDLRKQVFDIEMTKDSTNAIARADIIIGETIVAKDVPATTLLFLEKELNDVRTFIQGLPVLDAAEDWAPDANYNYLYKTEPQKVHRTKKVERPLVLYDATKEHPAQTKLVTEDVIIGHWETVKTTGAIAVGEKLTYWKNVNALLDAVKEARERANTTPVIEKKLGDSIFSFLTSS